MFTMGFLMPLTIKAEIEPDSLYQDLRSPHNTLITYTYDDAGNVILKRYYYVPLSNNRNIDEEEQQLVNDTEVFITANENWGQVTINIVGCIDYGQASLNIINMSGISHYSGKLNGNSLTLDLSSLSRGIYLFHFSIMGMTKNYKLIKK